MVTENISAPNTPKGGREQRVAGRSGLFAQERDDVERVEVANLPRQLIRLWHVPQVQSEHGDIYEQVTEPDVSPSLYQMITTATAGSMPGNNQAYEYPELGTDEQAHDHPDYEKLNKLDLVEKDIYVENWLQKEENYEIKKKEREEAIEAPDQVEKAKPEGTEG